MERVIKFRGQNPYTKEWVYGYYFVTTQLGTEHPQIWQENGVPLPVDPKTVGQYIGLADKQDKEIFEGDILSTDIRWFDDEDGWPLHTRPKKKNRVVKYMGIPLFHAGDWSFQPEDVEVIGNVWENPELVTQ